MWSAFAAAQDADAIGFADSAAPSQSAPSMAMNPDGVRFASSDAGLQPSTSSNQNPDDVGFGPGDAGLQPSAAGEPELAPAGPSPWTLSATLRVQSAVRLESDPPSRLAKLRQVFEPRIEWQSARDAGWQLRAVASARTEADFAVLMHFDAYSAPDAEVYGWQLLPRETYLAIASTSFEVRFGEQIVNLGQSEVLSSLDVVNPRDLREPLLADPAELRMPVLMTRLMGTLGSFRAEALIVHEPYFGLVAPPLGEFSPFRKLLLESPGINRVLASRTLSTEHIPGRDLTDFAATQAHGRIAWTGPDIDLAIMVSNLLDPLGVPALPPPAAFDSTEIAFPVLHPRYTLFGHSGALTAGLFVFRWELAYEHDRSIALRTTNDPLLRFSSVKRSGLRGLLGITFVPSSSTNAGLELMQGYIFDNPNRSPESPRELLFPLEAPQIALRVSQRFLRDRASISALWVRIGAIDLNAWVGRLEVSYAPFDRLELTLGCVTYQPTEQFGFFYGFTRHDRVFADLRWELL
jgi:hypothetical protein